MTFENKCIGFSYLVEPEEILFQPVEDVVLVKMSENALIQVGAGSSTLILDVVDVSRNFLQSRVGFLGTSVHFTLVRNPVVEGVRPDRAICYFGRN